MPFRNSRPQSRSEQLAQRGQAQQEVFLREVDDALREDQMLTAVRRYGRVLAALVVVGLLALGGWLWWDARRADQADKAGEKFVVALDQIEVGRLEQGATALEPLSKQGGDGYRSASRLMQAGIAVEQGRPEEAAKLFAQVAGDEDAPQPFRELARVREVSLRFDSMPPEQVVARLKPLAVPGSPWFGSAGELVGAAYLKQGREELAGPLFAAIAKDRTVPATLRSRAQQLAGLLGVDAVVDVEKAVAGSPVAAAGQP